MKAAELAKKVGIGKMHAGTINKDNHSRPRNI